jgi:rhamnosyl/mannosyltransferase
MKKTILHVSKYYYPYLGGIETLARSLAEGMVNYHNVVVCFATDGKDQVDEINGVTVYRVKVQFSLLSQDVAFGYYEKLKHLMAEFEPEYVHVHCPNPFVYPLVAKIMRTETKLVLHWHSDILSKGIFYQLVKPFESHILSKATRIIATSPNYIHPSSPICAYKEKISVVQNGMVPSDFDLKEGEEQKIANIKAKYDNKPLVLFVGRHIHYKGIDWLIDIAQMVKGDCKFIIAGQGPLTEKLKSKNISSKVEFTGKLPADELRCYAHAADIFAFTSNTKAEAFGIALAEAMYCGCVPVVFHLEGSGVNWVSIKDETGLEVPLGNLQAYAEAIDRLLSEGELRAKLSVAARQRASSLFTESKAVELMESVYQEL